MTLAWRTIDTPPLDTALDTHLDAAAQAEANAFLAASPAASYLQRPDWPALCPPSSRHRYVVLRARNSAGRLVGLGLARLSRLVPGLSMAWLRRGPVTATLEDLAPVTRAFAARLRAAGCVSMVVNPRWSGADAASAEDALAGLGARRLPDAEQSLHAATLLVDLSGDAGALKRRLKSRCRRQIGKAEAAGLVVRPAASLDEAMLFEPVFRNFHERRRLGTESIPSVPMQWQMTSEGGAFLLGWYEGRVICGHVVVADGDRAFWLTMASEDAPDDLPKSYALVWQALLSAQAQGFRTYDMAGAPRSDRLEGQTISRAEANRHQFKMAFDPAHVDLVPMMVLPLLQPAHDLLFTLRQRYRARTRASKRAAA